MRKNKTQTTAPAKPNTPISTTYYLIYGWLVGKRERFGKYETKEWLFRDGRWVPDTEFEIMDHLMGYDPSEPPGSPYAIGSTDVLMEMNEIPEAEALARIAKG